MDESERITRQEYDGHIYVSGNGQLVVDRHATDAEHLVAEQTRGEQPLYDCRVYVCDLVPTEWIGRRGKLVVHRVYDSVGEIAGVQLVFMRDEPGG